MKEVAKKEEAKRIKTKDASERILRELPEIKTFLERYKGSKPEVEIHKQFDKHVERKLRAAGFTVYFVDLEDEDDNDDSYTCINWEGKNFKSCFNRVNWNIIRI